MEGSRPFDSEVDFDHPRRARPEPPPPLAAERGHRTGGRPPRKPRRLPSETLARIAWALPWIAIVVTIAVIGGELFAAAMIGFACVGIHEFFRMTRDARPFLLTAFVVAAALVAAAFYGDQYQMMIVLAASILLIFLSSITRPDRDGITLSIPVTVVAIGWIGIPFAHAVLLRELPEHGAALLVDVLVGTFVADTAAYAGGRLFGRHRLAPALSPNKTLEGLACLYQDWLSGIDALLIGMAVAALAPIGDLFESMLKRDLQIKDSGTIFGPHGGLLDRLDAVLFTIVAGYYLAVLLVY